MTKRNSIYLWLILALVTVGARPVTAATLVLSPASLTFTTLQGSNPLPTTLSAYLSGGAPGGPSTATATTNNGGNWLSLALSFSTAGSLGPPSTVLYAYVQVNSQNLAPGTYFGQVAIPQAGSTGSPGQSPSLVPVTLNVLPSGLSYTISQNVLEINTPVGSNASSAFLTITTFGGPSVTPTLTATTSTGGNWIALSAPVASTLSPGVTVRVDFPTSALAAGFYSGSIGIAGAGVKNAPINIPVNLTVGTAQGPGLAVNPATVAFTASSGANPAPITLAINNSGPGAIAPSAVAYTNDGANWLSVALSTSPAGTGGSTTASVTVNANQLVAGSYSGTVVIMDPAVPTGSVQIPVSLKVANGAPILALAGKTVAFVVPPGGTQKQTSTIALTNAGTGGLSFTAATSTTSGGNWLSVSPASGSAPATLTFTADPTGLAPGVYSGQVVVAIPNAPATAQSPQTIAVSFYVGQNVPAISTGGIVNGASFASQVVSPGEIVSAFGANLGPPAGVPSTAVGNSLPTTLAGVQVAFTGASGSGTIAAPLYYASAGQLNLQVPYEVGTQASTTVQVTTTGIPGPTYTLQLRPADPAIFIANGRMAILDQSGRLINAGNPASPNQALTIFATGLGAVNPAIATGTLAPLGTLFNTLSLATVTLGGTAANVSFSGLAPTFVGLYQINFTVPSGVAGGDQPLILGIGTQQTLPLPLAVRSSDVGTERARSVASLSRVMLTP
jgi:uncharacterized protein (TIGR03437 family)